MRRLVCCLLAVAASASSAAPPGFDSLYPAGGRAGSTVEITVQGKELDKTHAQAWCDDPAVTIEPGDKAGRYRLTLPADAAPGPRLLRFRNDDGASPPRIFMIGDLAEQLEQEPNNNPEEARAREPAAPSVVFNGVLDKSGDVDTHAVRAKKGERLVLELHGYGLGSPMDPALRLLDARGSELALSHDTHNLDPYLEHTPTADGILFAQVFAFAHPPAADVSFKGSAHHVYRLIVREAGPPPPAPAAPGALTLPATVRGRLSLPRQTDRHRLSAKKNDEIRLRVRALAPRSPLDATLAIADTTGKILQQADDSDGLNPALRWKAPADGEYHVLIADRHHHGGPLYDYEITAAAAAAELTATLDTHAYQLEAGGKTEVKITVKIDGTPKGKIEARATDLPAGVSAKPVEVPAKGGEVKLTLQAAGEAAASQAPFRVEVVIAKGEAAEQIRPAEFVIPFNEPRGDLLLPRHPQPWLTLSAKAPAKKEAAKP